jgi:nucleotidyltransferase substrate binding protein (TIGR01987 family)
MDRVRERIELASKALATLLELSGETGGNKIVRDASIQRFEYSFEAAWKAAQLVLRTRFGLELGAPKPVIRACFENSILDETQTRLALAMTDHRNLTSHTYNEALADEIHAAIPAYRELLAAWLKALGST